MATTAYLMIDVAEKFCRNGYGDVLRDLADIREVQSIERIGGICDLLVKVEVPGMVGLVTDQIMPKQWIKALRVFNVEPAEPTESAPIGVLEFEHVETLRAR
ncbi:hypothetical protein ACFLWY_03835 [Chloroflexota bacterium]